MGHPTVCLDWDQYSDPQATWRRLRLRFHTQIHSRKLWPMILLPPKKSALLPAWLIFQATPALLAPRSRLENHLTAAQLEQKMDLHDMENTAAIDQSNSVHIIKQITKTHLAWTSTSEMLKQLANPMKKWSHGACKPQFATRVGAPCIDVTPSRTSEAMSRATTCCLAAMPGEIQENPPLDGATWLPPAWEQQNNKL